MNYKKKTIIFILIIILMLICILCISFIIKNKYNVSSNSVMNENNDSNVNKSWQVKKVNYLPNENFSEVLLTPHYNNDYNLLENKINSINETNNNNISIYYYYEDTEDTKIVEFNNIDFDTINKNLLKDIKIIDEIEHGLKEVMVIKISSIQKFIVYENGNIKYRIDNSEQFLLDAGKDKIDYFINYIINNYEGFILEYDEKTVDEENFIVTRIENKVGAEPYYWTPEKANQNYTESYTINTEPYTVNR